MFFTCIMYHCATSAHGKVFFFFFCIINVHNKEVVLQTPGLVYLHHLIASAANTPKGNCCFSSRCTVVNQRPSSHSGPQSSRCEDGDAASTFLWRCEAVVLAPGRQAAMCQACDRIDISSELIGRDRCRWSHVLSDITRSDRTFPPLFIFQTEACSLLTWGFSLWSCDTLLAADVLFYCHPGGFSASRSFKHFLAVVLC